MNSNALAEATLNAAVGQVVGTPPPDEASLNMQYEMAAARYEPVPKLDWAKGGAVLLLGVVVGFAFGGEKVRRQK